MPDPGRTALYRLYDSKDRLLYVGVTDTPWRRWSQHEDTKAWWSQVARKEAEWFDSREEALAAEVVAIQAELPAHNHQNKPSSIIGEITSHDLGGVPAGTFRPYEFMAHELRGFIQSGSLHPGDKLPTVRDLMDVYGVSSATVQRCLSTLKSQGFVTSRPGFGVCAALPTGFRRESATDAEPEGVIELLPNHQSAPAPLFCKALGVPPGTDLGGRSWVRRIDGVAVEVVHSYRHPEATVNDEVCRTVDIVSAEPPSGHFVTLLGGPVPLLTILRVTHASDGRPLDLFEIAKNGHLLSTSYEF